MFTYISKNRKAISKTLSFQRYSKKTTILHNCNEPPLKPLLFVRWGRRGRHLAKLETLVRTGQLYIRITKETVNRRMSNNRTVWWQL